jgi:hypothetical protein
MRWVEILWLGKVEKVCGIVGGKGEIWMGGGNGGVGIGKVEGGVKMVGVIVGTITGIHGE